MPPLALSVVSPCYDEEASLDELYARLTRVCREVAPEAYEIILVNDGSKDATWETMTRLAAQDPRLVAVNLSRNHGHQLALSAGLSFCTGERILIIDADLQDPPELLPAMMKRMEESGADVVYGQRRQRAGEGALKTLTAKLFYRLLSALSEVPIPLDTGDFRLLSRRALETLRRMPEHNRFLRGMVSWIGFKQEAFLYDRAPRFAGTTKYPMTKMLRFALDAITSFSIRPLRLASYLGVTFGAMGLLVLVYVLDSWLRGETVPGWTSLAAIVLVLGSCQLFVIGVVGEYLGRLYIEAKARPLYIVQDIVNGPQEKS